jgi:type II secretory pathway pseudopilin PulG
MRQKDLQNAEKFIVKHRLYRRWIIVISVLSIIVSAATFYLLNKPATAVSETTATEVGIADAQPAGEQAQAGAQESVAQDNAGASENNNGNAAGTEAAAAGQCAGRNRNCGRDGRRDRNCGTDHRDCGYHRHNGYSRNKD